MADGADETFSERRGDRRVNRALSMPPYQSAEGMVPVDRRCHLDRRANWIGECRIEPPDAANPTVDAHIEELPAIPAEGGCTQPEIAVVHDDRMEMPGGALDNC